MDLLEDFFKFLKTSGLTFSNRNPTLLAVSGGLDSVVMVHLFRAANIPFAIAHCNFQLRGDASDADESFVQKIALSFDVPFFIKRFETKAYADENGLSTQMAARNLRYQWFAEIAAENSYDYIAVAQHLNDSIETSLLNFVRGTGISGLTGIKPVPVPPGKGVIRPLLFASRKDILEYARIHEITWYEDSSNASDDYARNYVRHHIVPRLVELNPNFLNTAARNMGRIRDAEDNLSFLLNQWIQISAPVQVQGKVLHSISLQKEKITTLPAPQQALQHWLKPYGFDAEQARQIAEGLGHIGFELQSETGFRLLVDRENILIESPVTHHPEVGEPLDSPAMLIQADDLMVSFPDGTRLFLMPFEGHPSETTLHQPDSAIVNVSKLQFPLHLRHWQAGDSFQPLGMEGKSQKIQDFFTNHKLSRFEKEKVWLLFNGDGALIWVIGMRMDDRFKILSKTNKALKINWIK
jgi:tRNA(Ile)-lysidine synthase